MHLRGLLALQLLVEAGIGYGLLRYLPRTGSFYLGLRVIVVGLLVVAFLLWALWLVGSFVFTGLGPNPEGLFG
ncbi:hypothetical protein [uncultured Hymenobacter sp.]|uniref:hypothetical protein n=1 Tax=uncultured Hymenobacter sp. TaxID=170016 RepID=UPI0035CAC36B